MNEPCSGRRESRLFKAGGLLLLAVLFCWPSATQAGFTIWSGDTQALDIQTVDWLEIKGIGTLADGTLNVGVEGSTWSGDLFINSGGLLDANRNDGAGLQYSGTINVGPRLEMINGGRLILNSDYLNIFGYDGVDRDSSYTSIDGTFNVYSGSTVTADNSSMLGAATVRVKDSGSSFNLNKSTIGFHDELWVADGAVFNDIGSTIHHDNSIGRSEWERGDIIIANGSTVNLADATVDITGGTGGWLKVDNSTLTAADSNLATNWIESREGSTLTFDNSSVVSKDSIWHSNSTISQTGGETVFADELVLNQGAAMSVQGTVIDPAVIRHQAVAGETDNRGSLWLDDAFLSLTNADFDITSGVNGEIQVRNGSRLLATDSDLSSKATNIDESSQVGLTGSTLQTGNVDVNNGSALALDNSTVDTGSSEWMKIQGNSTLTAESNSQLKVGGVLQVQNGSTVTLTDSDVDAENLWVEHDGSKVEMTGGSLNARANIGIGNDGSPTGSLVLNGTTVTTGDLSVLGRLIANGSDIDAGDRFGGYGQDGTAAGVILTDSSLSTRGIDFNKSQHNYQNSTITSTDSTWFLNSTVTQAGGVTEFADQMFLLDDTAMTVQGTESNHAVVRHQVAADEDDNRGELIVDNSTLDLTYADVNLSSGDSGLLHVHDDGHLTTTSSTITSNSTIIETDSQMGLTGSTLQTGYVAVNNGSALSLENSTVDTGTSEGMKIQDHSTLTADGNSQVKVGGQLLVQDGSEVRLFDTAVEADSVWVEHEDSNIQMFGSSLTAQNKIGVGNIDAPNGRLELTDSTVQAGELTVLGSLSATGSTIQAGSGFNGFGQNGSGAVVALTDSELDANHIGFNHSTQTYVDSSLTSTDSISFENSTISQSGGETVFADQMFLLNGTDMTVEGTAADHATIRHEAVTGEVNNRGELVVDDSALNLAYADIDLSGGVSGLLQVHNDGALTAVDGNLVGNRIVVEDGGQAGLTREILTTNSLYVGSGSTFSATDATINILGNTTTIDAGGSMVLNGGVYTEAGDLLVNGSLSGAAPVINIGSDFILGDTGTVNFSGSAEMFVGDDFILDGPDLSDIDLSHSLHMLGSTDDDGNGSIFDSAAALGRLIVETSLTLLNDLVVDHLVIGTGWDIHLNGHSLVISESFVGSYDWITGGAVTGPAPVPEPSTLVLFSGGLLGLAWFWRRK